jgi:hypothetical protein
MLTSYFEDFHVRTSTQPSGVIGGGQLSGAELQVPSTAPTLDRAMRSTGPEVDPGNRAKREGVKRPALSQRMEYGYDQITQEV